MKPYYQEPNQILYCGHALKESLVHPGYKGLHDSPNFRGHERFWTKERVLAALAMAIREIKGSLPCSDSAWYKIKKGRFDWPPASRILGYFGSMARAWLAAGAPLRRVSLKNIDWTLEEDNYLKKRAGAFTLKKIAEVLGRTYPAVRKRLQKFGIWSRHNQGYFSAAELSKHFNCPYKRVRCALNNKLIKGRYDAKRNRWEVDLIGLTPVAEEILTRPKRTWKKGPTDHGDYEHRHGIVRKVIDGEVKRIEKPATALKEMGNATFLGTYIMPDSGPERNYIGTYI